MEVEEFVSEEELLRKEYAGVLGGKVRFDDRIALRENRRSFMVGFWVYEQESNASKNNLVALRAIYDDL